MAAGRAVTNGQCALNDVGDVTETISGAKCISYKVDGKSCDTDLYER